MNSLGKSRAVRARIIVESRSNNCRTNHYFLASRFMFPFIIIGLFFAVLSLFTGLLAMCTRIGSYLSGFLAWLALTFQVITTCLMTYVSLLPMISRNWHILIPPLVPFLSRAVQPSRTTAKARNWASRPSPSCGPPAHVCSFRVFYTASAVPLADVTPDTVDARSAAAASSPRHARTACGARGRRTTPKGNLLPLKYLTSAKNHHWPTLNYSTLSTSFSLPVYEFPLLR